LASIAVFYESVDRFVVQRASAIFGAALRAGFKNATSSILIIDHALFVLVAVAGGRLLRRGWRGPIGAWLIQSLRPAISDSLNAGIGGMGIFGATFPVTR
jgi:hypothetical protein